jgi:hypothetical protein
MNQHYRQIKGSKPINENGKEFTLSVFGGMCYHCKHMGHKTHECPKKGGNNSGNGKGNQGSGNGKFQKKCDNWGQVGHKAADCWEKAKNQRKRLKWFKDKWSGEVGAAVTDDGGREVKFLLCGVTKFSFPQNQDMLMDPNVWITNLAAMVHTTAHKQGFHMLMEATNADSITMGNGIAKKASLVGKLTGTMCNKNGIELVHLPTEQFNLFSLKKMTQQGWILGGDAKEIWLMKSKQRLSFDIAIPTPKGMFFAMYIRRNMEIAGANTDNPKPSVSIQTAHDRLGHPGEDMTRKVANELG